MRAALVRLPVLVVVLAAVALDAALLFAWWPAGVVVGVVGGAVFALVLGLRLQHEADAAERSSLFDEVAPVAEPEPERAVLRPAAA